MQVFKFAIYVAIPVTLTFYVAQNRDVLSSIIKNVSHMSAVSELLPACAQQLACAQRSYVVYPPEAKRPPTAEEFEEILKARQAQLAAARKKAQE